MNATSILLEPLGDDECEALIGNLARRRATRRRPPRPHHGRLRRKPAVRRGDARDGARARRRRGDRRPADDPRAPAGPHRLARRRRPRRDGARLGRGRGVPSWSGRATLARSCSRRRRVASDDARAQGAHPLDRADLPRGRGVPLPPSAHPRRGVRVASEGDACGAARAVRRLALDARPGRRGRDRRIPPRAGASLPSGARSRATSSCAVSAAGRADIWRQPAEARSTAATTTRVARSSGARSRSFRRETIAEACARAGPCFALWESGDLDEAQRSSREARASSDDPVDRCDRDVHREHGRLPDGRHDVARGRARSELEAARAVLEAAGDDEGLGYLLVGHRGRGVDALPGGGGGAVACERGLGHSERRDGSAGPTTSSG